MDRMTEVKNCFQKVRQDLRRLYSLMNKITKEINTDIEKKPKIILSDIGENSAYAYYFKAKKQIDLDFEDFIAKYKELEQKGQLPLL